MTERPYSLVDVQLGMKSWDLHLLLTPPLFTFFWGLVMTANKLNPRFKNPFDLTVLQGQAAGGGNSRQALWQRQQKLKKIRIDKQWLVKIKCGNYQKNVPATYEINYNLLVPQTLMMPQFEAHPSKILDAPVDGSVDANMTDPLTILRSDQKREETTTEEVVADLPSADEEPMLTIKSDATIIEGAILTKYRSQIMDRPPSPNALRDALESWRVDQLTEAIERMPLVLKNIRDGNGVLGLACKAAANPGWWSNDGDGGKPDNSALIAEYRANLAEWEAKKAANPDKAGECDVFINIYREDIAELEAKI